MITWDIVLGAVLLIWIFLHTISYGKWTWNKKNYLGAIMIYVVDIFVLGLPFYLVFIRQ